MMILQKKVINQGIFLNHRREYQVGRLNAVRTPLLDVTLALGIVETNHLLTQRQPEGFHLEGRQVRQ